MKYATSVGLDVHAKSVRAAAFVIESGEIVERGFPNDAGSIIEWIDSLPKPVQTTYEAGPTGYALYRRLEEAGIACVICAPSKITRPSGDKVKTDKRDAVWLARMLAVGNLTSVWVADKETESYRDLVRAREDTRADLTRIKHRISKFLLRKGIAYESGKKAWTKTYVRWLHSLIFSQSAEKIAFDSYLDELHFTLSRQGRLDAQIERYAHESEYKETVERLSGIRGISTYTAFAVAVEIGDFSRFKSPRHLAMYLGLTPSESSSGQSTVRGPITKTGNAYVRKLLIESAWNHRRAFSKGAFSAREEVATLPDIARHIAIDASERLHKRYVHLVSQGKPFGVVITALAREIACWCHVMVLA